MEQFLDKYGYLALFAGTFFEGETAILVASSLIHRGLFDIPYTVLAGFAGSFVSDWIYFIIGRLNGRYFVSKRPALQAKLAPVQHFFETHRLQILLSYRFLYGFRVMIPLVIGMSTLRPLQYLGYSVFSGLVWATTVSTAGYFVGRFLDLKTSVFEENILFIMLGFAGFGMLLGYVIKRIALRRIATAEPEIEV